MTSETSGASNSGFTTAPGASSRGLQDALSAIERVVFHHASHLIVATDPEGVIIAMNPSAERALGWQARELVGRLTPLIFHDADEITARARFLTLKLGKPVGADIGVFQAEPLLGLKSEHEWTYIARDGTRFPVLLSVTALRDPQGVLLGFVGMSSDLTERNQREAALRESEVQARARRVAERSNAAKSRFLAAAAHDLRQPLQAMFLYQRVLENKLHNSEYGPAISRLGEAMTATRDLLNALLDISVLEAGGLQTRLGNFRLSDVVGDIVREFDPLATEKNLFLHQRRCDHMVYSDPILLGRMLRNLVDNAIRYTATGGILVSSRLKRGALLVQVWDSGIGIPAEKIDQIFEPFMRLATTGISRSDGMGLGLATVQKMAVLLGHDLSVRSRLGRGSVFTLRLPLGAISP